MCEHENDSIVIHVEGTADWLVGLEISLAFSEIQLDFFALSEMVERRGEKRWIKRGSAIYPQGQ